MSKIKNDEVHGLIPIMFETEDENEGFQSQDNWNDS
jgi:hypothetical protein